MIASIIKTADIAYLNDVLLDGEFLKPVAAKELQKINLMHLRQWAVKNARYQFITTELVDFLKDAINGRTALEIGAGQGDLGHALNIPMTDNYCQQLPEMKWYYETLQQATTNPPAQVEKIDGVDAVRKYNPKVVIASWVTQKYHEGDESNGTGSNVYGPEEMDILTHDSVEMYIHIGNHNIHKEKRILKVNHKAHQFDWLVSRASAQELNTIWIWGK